MKNAKSERKRSISDSFGKENILLFVFSVLTAFFVLMLVGRMASVMGAAPRITSVIVEPRAFLSAFSIPRPEVALPQRTFAALYTYARIFHIK